MVTMNASASTNKKHSSNVTNLQKCSHSGGSSHTQSGAHQKPSILTLHTLNLKRALRGDMEVSISIAWEHEDLAAFLGPKHRGRWVACCHTLKTRQTIQTHLLVRWFCCECWWSCNHM